MTPLDRLGSGRRELAIVRDTPELYPGGVPGAPVYPVWQCTKVQTCDEPLSQDIDCKNARDVPPPTGPCSMEAGNQVGYRCREYVGGVIGEEWATRTCSSYVAPGSNFRASWDYFTYSGGDTLQVATEPPRADPNPMFSLVHAVDEQGDRTEDLAERNADITEGDFNGDGLMDIAGPRPIAVPSGRPSGTGFRTGTGVERPPALALEGAGIGRNWRLIDWDGDGRTDLLNVGRGEDGKMTLWQWREGGWQKRAISIAAGHWAAGAPHIKTLYFKCDAKSVGGSAKAWIAEAPACSPLPGRTGVGYCPKSFTWYYQNALITNDGLVPIEL
jgi:hypothetical protein